MMTAALIWHPRLAEGCDRINALAAEANRAEERAEAIETCKRIIDDPRGYSDEQLREVCGFYMSYGDGGVHYLRADAHIWAINRREKMGPIPPQVDDDTAERRKELAALILGGLAVVALVVAGVV